MQGNTFSYGWDLGNPHYITSSNPSVVQIIELGHNDQWIFDSDDDALFEDYNSSRLGYSMYSLYGKYPGTSVITAYDYDGKYTKCTITVTAPLNVNKKTIAISKYQDYYINASGTLISKASTSDSSVAAIKKITNQKIKIIPKKIGRATITIQNKYGVKNTVSVSVSKSFFQSWLKSSEIDTIKYGDKKITGYTVPGTKVSIKINGKN